MPTTTLNGRQKHSSPQSNPLAHCSASNQASDNVNWSLKHFPNPIRGKGRVKGTTTSRANLRYSPWDRRALCFAEAVVKTSHSIRCVPVNGALVKGPEQTRSHKNESTTE